MKSKNVGWVEAKRKPTAIPHSPKKHKYEGNEMVASVGWVELRYTHQLIENGGFRFSSTHPTINISYAGYNLFSQNHQKYGFALALPTLPLI